MHYGQIIEQLRSETDEVVLFHSATGKDSIMLLDLLSKRFKSVQCVFMYIVKGLEYENRYIQWAENRYPNCQFIQTPHYAVYSFIKNGYLGIKKDPSQTLMKISGIDKNIREKFGLNHSVYGFKKVDGITRRVFLNTVLEGIHPKTKKCYPLMDLTNKDVLNYISDNQLIEPFNYGTLKPSSGCDISTPEFLAYIKERYPSDLQKIFAQYPHTEINLFKHERFKKREDKTE